MLYEIERQNYFVIVHVLFYNGNKLICVRSEKFCNLHEATKFIEQHEKNVL